LVVVQTYWPDHPAILAAASHDPRLFYEREEADRRALGYPPFGRLANLLVWGKERKDVADACATLAHAVQAAVPQSWQMLGPSPAPMPRLKGVWRWHILVKAPLGAPLPAVLGVATKGMKRRAGVSVACDIDPLDLL
jgi:primosomal protein N' (replication factor Y)